jgi:hypothetical protein
MIVHDFDILGVPHHPPETDAPLVVDHLACSLSFQQFRAISRRVTLRRSPPSSRCRVRTTTANPNYFEAYLFVGFRRRTPGPPPFDVVLKTVWCAVAALEEAQDPVNPSRMLFGLCVVEPRLRIAGRALASEERIAMRLLRSMLTSEFKRASRSRMELLSCHRFKKLPGCVANGMRNP